MNGWMVMKMSKAVLVIDMPKNCSECPCREVDSFLDENCRAVRRKLESSPYENKPDWCPLRPLPGKMPIVGGKLERSRQRGWNNCIDEITEKLYNKRK